MEVNIPKILVAFDFDRTLLDCNSDVKIEALTSSYIFPEQIQKLRKVPNRWIDYMGEVFKFLHENKLTKEDYMRCLSELPLVQGMKELLQEMHKSETCDIIIISDANDFFVQFILKEHGLTETVSKIFTNPAEFDDDGCLRIRKFHEQNMCKRCPSNLCKGSVLNDYIEKQNCKGVSFLRVLYIGDGSNDVCPARKLGGNDFVYARKGYRMLKFLEKLPENDIQATVHGWDTGTDIKKSVFDTNH